MLEFKFNKPTPYEIVLCKNKKPSIHKSEGEDDSNKIKKFKLLYYLIKFILLIWFFIIIGIISNFALNIKKIKYQSINLNNANNNYIEEEEKKFLTAK